MLLGLALGFLFFRRRRRNEVVEAGEAPRYEVGAETEQKYEMFTETGEIFTQSEEWHGRHELASTSEMGGR